MIISQDDMVTKQALVQFGGVKKAAIVGVPSCSNG